MLKLSNVTIINGTHFVFTIDGNKFKMTPYKTCEKMVSYGLKLDLEQVKSVLAMDKKNGIHFVALLVNNAISLSEMYEQKLSEAKQKTVKKPSVLGSFQTVYNAIFNHFVAGGTVESFNTDDLNIDFDKCIQSLYNKAIEWKVINNTRKELSELKNNSENFKTEAKELKDKYKKEIEENIKNDIDSISDIFVKILKNEVSETETETAETETAETD